MTLDRLRFSADAWRRNKALYDRILILPFNVELAEGRLGLEAFRHYMVQDAKYLIAFAQALAVASARADDPDQIRLLRGGRAGGHRGRARPCTPTTSVYSASTKQPLPQPPMSPACHHYTSFLLATGFRETLAVHVAALLPCFWVYREVGQSHSPDRSGGQSLPGLDRHLCGRRVRGCGRCHHCRDRRRGWRGEPQSKGGNARGILPVPCNSNGCSGTRLIAWNAGPFDRLQKGDLSLFPLSSHHSMVAFLLLV